MVVSEAGKQGFLEHIILNCLEIDSAGLNWLGDPVLNRYDCLSNWMMYKQASVPIPHSGPCRHSFQTLVFGAVDNWLTEPHSVIGSEGCIFASGSFEVTYGCWLAMEAELKDFRASTGSYIEGGRCDAVDVLEMAGGQVFVTLVEDGTSPLPLGVSPLVPTSGSSCYGCYERFSEIVHSHLIATPDVADVCGSDPTDSLCGLTTMVQEAKAEFRQCSGYDIAFAGGVCDMEEIARIEDLIPNTYSMLVESAFATEDIHRIDPPTQCWLCYEKFQEHVREVSQGIGWNPSECTHDPEGDVCIASLAEPLIKFYACSGFPMVRSEQGEHGVSATTESPMGEWGVLVEGERSTTKSAGTRWGWEVIINVSILSWFS
jgi:hypothetical protein